MNSSLIPWREFLETLRQQQPRSRQFWLRRWMFTNEGAMLADRSAANTPWMRALWSGKHRGALALKHASAPNES
jgi:hypothetical protein